MLIFCFSFHFLPFQSVSPLLIREVGKKKAIWTRGKLTMWVVNTRLYERGNWVMGVIYLLGGTWGPGINYWWSESKFPDRNSMFFSWIFLPIPWWNPKPHWRNDSNSKEWQKPEQLRIVCCCFIYSSQLNYYQLRLFLKCDHMCTYVCYVLLFACMYAPCEYAW